MAGKQAKSGRAGKAEKVLWMCHCGKKIKGLAEGLDHTSKCDAEQKAARAAKDRAAEAQRRREAELAAARRGRN